MKRTAFPGETRQVSSSLLFLLEGNAFHSPRLNEEVCREGKTGWDVWWLGLTAEPQNGQEAMALEG